MGCSTVISVAGVMAASAVAGRNIGCAQRVGGATPSTDTATTSSSASGDSGRSARRPMLRSTVSSSSATGIVVVVGCSDFSSSPSGYRGGGSSRPESVVRVSSSVVSSWSLCRRSEPSNEGLTSRSLSGREGPSAASDESFCLLLMLLLRWARAVVVEAEGRLEFRNETVPREEPRPLAAVAVGGGGGGGWTLRV